MTVPFAHLGSVDVALPQLLPIVLVWTMYVVRARTLGREGRPVPTWRGVCFTVGLVLMVVALSGLGHLSSELVVAHMGEHLLLGDIATLLLVLGLTGPL